MMKPTNKSPLEKAFRSAPCFYSDKFPVPLQIIAYLRQNLCYVVTLAIDAGEAAESVRNHEQPHHFADIGNGAYVSGVVVGLWGRKCKNGMLR